MGKKTQLNKFKRAIRKEYNKMADEFLTKMKEEKFVERFKIAWKILKG